MIATRRIRRLELRAPPGVGLAGPQALVTDALRTASVPGLPPGAVLVIRRLDLGVLDRNLPAATLALRIEAHLRRLASSAVRFTPERAREAEAVWFADAAEIPVAFVRARIGGAARGDWIWSRVIPDCPADDDPVRAVRAAIRAALDTAAPALAVARVLDALVEARREAWFVDTLTRDDTVALWRACGWSAPPPPRPARRIALDAPPRWRPLLRALAQRDPADPRTRWLATIALVARTPLLLAYAAPWRHGDALIAALRDEAALKPVLHQRVEVQPEAAHRDPLAPPEDSEAPTPPREKAQASDEPAATPAPDGSAPPAQAPPPDPGPGEPPLAPPGPTPPRPAAERTPAEYFDQPVATMAGGLFFLVPALRRLGIEALLADDDRRPDLAGHILHAALVAAEIPPEDPMYLAFDRAPDRSEPLPFVAPAIWSAAAPAGLRSPETPFAATRRRGDPEARIICVGERWPIALWRGTPPTTLPTPTAVAPELPVDTDLGVWVTSWLGALDRWLRRHAAVDLVECVRRPGAVTLSPVHVTAIFDLADADVRLRRAALDIDPGYVPWLGRVIHFHFLHGGRF